MANHKRIAIKKFIKDLLNDKTICGNNIFLHRYIPFEENYEFPALCIYCVNEEIIEEIQPSGEIRELNLNFIILNRTCSEENFTSDTIANQIESCIAKYKSDDLKFNYIGMNFDASIDDSIYQNETTILSYKVKYFTSYYENNDKLNDLKETYVSY